MTSFRPTGKISFNQQFTQSHNVSAIPGMNKLSPFFLVFGRHAPSPETLTLALPLKPFSQQTYAENVVSLLSDAKKEFDRIKAGRETGKGVGDRG